VPRNRRNATQRNATTSRRPRKHMREPHHCITASPHDNVCPFYLQNKVQYIHTSYACYFSGLVPGSQRPHSWRQRHGATAPPRGLECATSSVRPGRKV
jgi:hypothetical protein